MKKQYIFIFVLLAVAGMISWKSFFSTYVQKDTVNIHVFPKTIGKWKSEELKITEHEYDILETRNAFVRQYSTPDGHQAMLYIIYSQTNRKVAHPPELCYTGAGNGLLSKESATVSVGAGKKVKIVKMFIEKDGLKQVVTYFFKVGDTYTPSYIWQQLLIAVKSFFGQPSSSAMIRLSALYSEQNPEKAMDDIELLLKDIYPLLPKYLP